MWRVRCDPQRPNVTQRAGRWFLADGRIYSGRRAELDERGQLGHLPVQVLCAVVAVLRMPVDALGPLLVGCSVHGLDQGPAQALASASRVDEQVFQVAVAEPRPGRRMDMEVDDAGNALAIEGGQALEGMGGVEQTAPGQVSDVGWQVVLVELQVAAPELVPALAIGGLARGRTDSVFSAALRPFLFFFSSFFSSFSPVVADVFQALAHAATEMLPSSERANALTKALRTHCRWSRTDPHWDSRWCH